MASFEGILYLALLILFAKLFEELAVRLRQPPIIGYVVAGILLGPALLSWVEPQPEITLFIQIGVFFLFFLIGLEEIDIPGIFSALRKRIFAGAAAGFAVPFALASIAFFTLTDLEPTPILAIASVIGISSLGVVAKILSDYGKLKEPLGLEIFTLTAILEFVGIIVASVFIQLAQPTGFSDTVNEIFVPAPEGAEPLSSPEGPFDYLSFAWLFVRMVIFFAGVTIFGLKALPHIMRFIGRHMKVREMYFGMFVGIILLVSYFAEASGVHGAIGALLLGVMFSQMPRKEYADIVKGVHSLAHGVFIPIFFAGIGIYFSFSFLSLPYYLIAAVLAVVTLGKFGGAILAAVVAKLRPVLTVGSGVMAKGAVDLAIMLSLLSAEIIMPELFSLVVFGIVIMILATSITLKRQMSLASSSPKEVAKEISVEAADTVMPLYTRIALLDLSVRDVYTETPPTVSGDLTITQFVGKEGMSWKPAYIAVSPGGKYVGLVKPDNVHRVGKVHWDDTLVSQIANPHPRAFRLDDFLYDVIEYMALHDLEILAVVSEDGKLAGGIMRKDVLRYISR